MSEEWSRANPLFDNISPSMMCALLTPDSRGPVRWNICRCVTLKFIVSAQWQALERSCVNFAGLF